jgi:hypothetical protein
MRYVVVSMSVAALAVALVAGSAEAKMRRTAVTNATHRGTFVSAVGGKLVMTGNSGKEHSHPFAKNATFTVAGKPGTLAGFKKGMHISVTTDKSGHVTALSTVETKAVAPATKGASTTKPAPVSAPVASPGKSAT